MDGSLVRRPSTTESTSSSGGEVTFDDVDDSQVFAYLDEVEENRYSGPTSPQTVEFRLDFSSRPNPGGLHSANSGFSLSRRPSTGSLIAATRVHQRSPSMKSSAPPFRKRLSRRASDISSRIVLGDAGKTFKSDSVPSESAQNSPPSIGPLPSSVGPTMSSELRSTQMVGGDTSTPSPEDLVLTATSIHTSVVENLEAEKETLRSELSSARLNVSELLERLQASERHNESLVEQLACVKESYEIKLRYAYDEAASVRKEICDQKEREMEALRDAFDKERQLLEEDMKATISKIECELQSDSERLQRLLRDGRNQTNALKTQIASLQAELKASETEKHRMSVTDASLVTRYEALQVNANHWELKCQGLQDQVHQLLSEQDEMRQREHAYREANEKKAALYTTLHDRFRSQVQLLQSQLKALAIESRQTIEREVKRTNTLLNRLHQQASELSINANDKAMALVAKQNRIIQLEAQLKNERQSVLQLDSTLEKANRSMQRKETYYKGKLHEQKEFLDITVAVRNGLTNELQNKKKKLEELEKQLQEAKRGKDTADIKNNHLLQQVKIMQHIHAREMEQVALLQKQKLNVTRRSSRISISGSDEKRMCGTSVFSLSGGVTASYKFSSLMRRTSDPVTSSSFEGSENGLKGVGGECGKVSEASTRRGWLPEDDVFAAEEWQEFVELAALHETESFNALQEHQKSREKPYPNTL